MRAPVNLWIMTLTAPPLLAAAIGDLFAETSVSQSVLCPPRSLSAMVEVIFDREPNLSDVTGLLSVFALLHKIKLPTPVIRPAPKLDWLKKVAEDFPPLRIGRWTIHGAMHRAKVPSRLYALQIDATNAFGTGEHPTTRGCLLMLDALLKSGFRPHRMADIGCGSGVLAMAAIQGARCRAVGVDLDPDSVQIAARNARANGLGCSMRLARGRGYAPPVIAASAPYDLIMANIFARPLSNMAKDLKKHLRPGGVAILSGLLTTQAKMVIAAHRMQGVALAKHMKIGEWSVLALRYPGNAL